MFFERQAMGKYWKHFSIHVTFAVTVWVGSDVKRFNEARSTWEFKRFRYREEDRKKSRISIRASRVFLYEYITMVIANSFHFLLFFLALLRKSISQCFPFVSEVAEWEESWEYFWTSIHEALATMSLKDLPRCDYSWLKLLKYPHRSEYRLHGE